MNSVINTIMGHRSIRAFTDEAITEQEFNTIIQAGMSGSSSHFMQVLSVIRIKDKDKRKKLAQLAGNQAYVESAAEFLVFCIDFQRHYELNENVKPEFMELTLVGAVDAGIMAQNCLIAAESMGLGGVFIGGLRNNPAEVDALLELPAHTAVLFGMCLGHPDQNPEHKPRLPQEVVVHTDSYHSLDKALIDGYDQTMQDYYLSRSSNVKQAGWSKEITAYLSKESRPFILGYLQSKGLAKK
ncbi:oxygen-insensitive NADPH nitroreductase [Vibrio tritonius]|uniref:Oxygen-insensitive NADPH nitroreductase n=1 Tax=Vibrio tritonius TaxID=1435069 RepID=A0ABS7YQ93_9VIBR|nr:oxygen-insensitive NADPH nitroreductase [Vibrio tritonius]MCA2017850.1 oxygen-insensitive NADPH nitroreductase [Vibrio tritonius]